MNTHYRAEIYDFDKQVEHTDLTLADAALLIRDRKAAAVLVDLVEPHELDKWWNDAAFPPITQHQSFAGAGKSGLAIGPTQRLVNEQLIPGLIDYFSYAGRTNAALRDTEFVRLCARELGASAVQVGNWGELPLVSKREYQPVENGLYSVPPHCDAIHFGREPHNWPIKDGYDEGYDQISIFLSVQDARNSAGLVMWDYRPATRAELDELMSEFTKTRRIDRLDHVRSVTINGRPGQLNILNTRVMHAVEQCTTVRQTLGSFLVWHEGQWRMFH
ncbi:hypothetical protein ACVBGC_18040 [Burkholderia stagnalis]